ncbi:MAG TPA: YigZ family protein [Gemmatimonas sp.]|uniref:YigZ family protein n=1 Tax=Gemmatimonas sp. TaxID=1962908 RepID=UPI002EDA256D
MSDSARYPVPATRHRIEQVIDRSRFVCTIERVRTTADAQAFIKEMNVEFPDATHNCWAYVVGVPGSTDRIGMSDDGEPHGTAGRPMLTVLAHCGIGEIAAVVTRYYGGIKLGTGGLVKAYGGAVQEALATLATVERVDTVTVTFAVGYGQIGAVQQLLPTVDAEVLEQQFEADAQFTVRLPRTQYSTLQTHVQNLMRGTAVFLLSDDAQ